MHIKHNQSKKYRKIAVIVIKIQQNNKSAKNNAVIKKERAHNINNINNRTKQKIQNKTKQNNTDQTRSNTIQHNTTQHTQHNTIQHNMIQYDTIKIKKHI
jgi:hypothetical protein